jgi:molybdopterin-synthase adenylyltransferase
MYIGLKPCAWERSGTSLLVVCDPSRQVELNDPDGHAQTMLSILARRPHTPPELRLALAESGLEVTDAELAAAVAALDSIRLLTDPNGGTPPPPLRERYFSNLAFFDLFASLQTAGYDFQQRVSGAHVLQLGVGGLGSNALQSLAGLGVGRLTLLDHDTVEPRNFARQFLYRERDIGRPKVLRAAEWVGEFDHRIEVSAVQRRIGGPDDVADLLPGVDVVVSGVDQPDEIDSWVNAACVAAGVPWVRGGMGGSDLVYFSVDSGRGPCLACRQTMLDEQTRRGGDPGSRLAASLGRVNRGIGPAAALIGALVALEGLRYLTGFEPPQAAGAQVYVPLAGDAGWRREPWAADPGCPLCEQARSRRGAAVSA